MDLILQNLIRKYTQSPGDTDLARQIANLVVRSQGTAAVSVEDVLPLCQYGSFLLSIINTHGTWSRLQCLRASPHAEVSFAEIVFESEITPNCLATFDLEHDATLLWPLQRAEDQADSRTAFFMIDLRDRPRDIVYTFQVNDNTVSINNELGATGWATQTNFTSYIEGLGFEVEIDAQRNVAEGNWEIPWEPLSPTSAVEAMQTFSKVLEHLNIIGPRAFSD